MSSDSENDGVSQGGDEDFDKISPPQSPSIAPGSPWHPHSPEIPEMTIHATDATNATGKACNTVSDGIQPTGDLTEELKSSEMGAIKPEGEQAIMIEEDEQPIAAEEVEYASVASVPLALPAHTEQIQQPLRKKAKIGHSSLRRAGSTAKTAMKYAAVAFAGGAAGAMGTVYALASLPPDYFA